MKPSHHCVLTLIGALALAATPALSQGEETAPPVTLPEKILAAVRQAAPGIVIDETESEKTAQGVIYEVEGKANGQDVTVKVSAEGTVIAVENGEDDKPGEDDKDKGGDD